MIERETYGILEWLGDVGGLYDALRLIGVLLVAPFAQFWLKSELLSNIFRLIPSHERNSQAKEYTRNLTKSDCMN